jgi:hypothetical protein
LARAHWCTARCPALAALLHVRPPQGQPSSRAHCSAARWPPTAAYAHTSAIHGQPFSRAHCSTCGCPPFTARAHVVSPHGQPLAQAHWSTARCPPSAALAHVCPSHGQPLARAHWTTARCPPVAAFAHVRPSHGQPFARAHWSTERLPPSAALEHGPSPKCMQGSHAQPCARKQSRCSSCPSPAARVSILALSGMRHDAAHSSLRTEPSAVPILVESRAPAALRSVPATASRSLRHVRDAASSSSAASFAATATSSSAGRSSSRQSSLGVAGHPVAVAVVVHAPVVPSPFSVRLISCHTSDIIGCHYSHRRALRRQRTGLRLSFLAEYIQTIVTLVRRIRCNGDETQKSQPQLFSAQPS